MSDVWMNIEISQQNQFCINNQKKVESNNRANKQ